MTTIGQAVSLIDRRTRLDEAILNGRSSPAIQASRPEKAWPSKRLQPPVRGDPRMRSPALHQDATSPAALRVAVTASRAARAIRPLSLAMVTKRKPMLIIRAA